jgi:DNA-binding GntR family transcriptional regulator
MIRLQTSAIRPVARLSAEVQAANSLRTYILSGAVKPGARLTEMSLADQLGISRATLRSALQRLTSEGIIVQIPYTGWEVVALSAQDIWELWTLRGSLESLASRIAAERMTPDRCERLQQALQDLDTACQAGRIQDVNETDFAFHRLIVGFADHSRLVSQYNTVEQQVRLYIASTNVLNEHDLSIIVQDHTPLAEALLQKDPPRAALEAWILNENVGKRLLSLME